MMSDETIGVSLRQAAEALNAALREYGASALQIDTDALVHEAFNLTTETPDGYWWVIREDADGNEVSRTLEPWPTPPTA
jgi:hypothetical protein